MDNRPIIPLIIDGKDVLTHHDERRGRIAEESSCGPSFYQGATKELAQQAAESSAKAYTTWSRTTPIERRSLLFKLAEVCRW